MNEQTRILTPGAEGDDVKQLQAGLLALGCSVAPDELAGALFGQSTRKALLDFQRRHDLAVTGAVDVKTAAVLRSEVAARPSRYHVLGVVRHPNGRPCAGLTVRAYDRDLRREQSLGEARTDDHGQYQITYSREQFTRAEKGSADLL